MVQFDELFLLRIAVNPYQIEIPIEKKMVTEIFDSNKDTNPVEKFSICSISRLISVISDHFDWKDLRNT